MKKNVGSIDKGIRILLAAVVVLLNYFEIINGSPALTLLIIAMVLIVTSFANFCPLYALIGKNTCKIK
jgi:hypothetical protein